MAFTALTSPVIGWLLENIQFSCPDPPGMAEAHKSVCDTSKI